MSAAIKELRYIVPANTNKDSFVANLKSKLDEKQVAPENKTTDGFLNLFYAKVVDLKEQIIGYVLSSECQKALGQSNSVYIIGGNVDVSALREEIQQIGEGVLSFFRSLDTYLLGSNEIICPLSSDVDLGNDADKKVIANMPSGSNKFFRLYRGETKLEIKDKDGNVEYSIDTGIRKFEAACFTSSNATRAENPVMPLNEMEFKFFYTDNENKLNVVSIDERLADKKILDISITSPFSVICTYYEDIVFVIKETNSSSIYFYNCHDGVVTEQKNFVEVGDRLVGVKEGFMFINKDNKLFGRTREGKIDINSDISLNTEGIFSLSQDRNMVIINTDTDVCFIDINSELMYTQIKYKNLNKNLFYLYDENFGGKVFSKNGRIFKFYTGKRNGLFPRFQVKDIEALQSSFEEVI